ncbi:hypothetical protein MHU86_10097 [Fragilaria crotonensis]|nr:hypothetical protein MHU86_10097 [Fragilaria crotonensis]
MSFFEDFDNSAVTEDVSDGTELCLCQKLYEEAGNQKKVLYMMCCVGLRDRDGNSPLFCLESEPWQLQLPKTALLRPKNTDFCNEVARRATLFNVQCTPTSMSHPDYNPGVAPASECHVDYVSATVCSYEQVQALSPATPQKIQDIFASMRSDLLRIISRWEQSGPGEGGMKEEVDDENAGGVSLSGVASSVSEDDENQQHHGSLARRPARALQTRAAFLNGRPLYLYFWCWQIVTNFFNRRCSV